MTTNYRRFPTYTQQLSDFRWRASGDAPYATLAERRTYYERTGSMVDYYPTTGDFYREYRRISDRDFDLDRYREVGKRVDYYPMTGSFYRRDFFRKYGNTSSYARSVTKSSNFARGVTAQEEHNPREHSATKTWGKTFKRA